MRGCSHLHAPQQTSHTWSEGQGNAWNESERELLFCSLRLLSSCLSSGVLVQVTLFWCFKGLMCTHAILFGGGIVLFWYVLLCWSFVFGTIEQLKVLLLISKEPRKLELIPGMYAKKDLNRRTLDWRRYTVALWIYLYKIACQPTLGGPGMPIGGHVDVCASDGHLFESRHRTGRGFGPVLSVGECRGR